MGEEWVRTGEGWVRTGEGWVATGDSWVVTEGGGVQEDVVEAGVPEDTELI